MGPIVLGRGEVFPIAVILISGIPLDFWCDREFIRKFFQVFLDIYDSIGRFSISVIRYKKDTKPLRYLSTQYLEWRWMKETNIISLKSPPNTISHHKRPESSPFDSSYSSFFSSVLEALPESSRTTFHLWTEPVRVIESLAIAHRLSLHSNFAMIIPDPRSAHTHKPTPN